MTPQEIVIRPLITEKSHRLMTEHNQYSFEVHRDATKIDIRRAVEALFKVHVVAVNTLNVRGKRRRVGRFVGKRPDWKKAIVTLKAGERIEGIEGV
ncbi:MAG: 50S ribosomal protein L23 [Limnochordaceae bacterium]|nr:50S ribosomal protein L23 [Limnochordaceae bacterium]